jgi:uncharacterized delta-60 repeat protein
MLFSATSASAATAGRLDRSFGLHGTVVTPIGTGDAAASGVAVQSNGRIVVAGFASNGSDDDFAVTRYGTDGTLDPSFGAGGIALTDLGSADRAEAVALQPDGRIVAAGFSDNDIAVVRYRTDGTPDPTFGTGGVARIGFGGLASAESVAVQSDGKIVAAGWVITRRQSDLAVARTTPSGAPDATFSGDGKLTMDLGSSDYVSALAIQTDCKLVVAGASGEDGTQFALARILPTGIPDHTFGPGTGFVVSPFPVPASWGNAVALEPDGSICVGGFADDGTRSRIALARYSSSGELDVTFGGGGEVMTRLGAAGAGAQSILLLADGKLLVAGNRGDDFLLARYTSAGVLDPSFGRHGRVFTDLGALDQAEAAALQPDGRVVLAGFTGDDSRISFALARYRTE